MRSYHRGSGLWIATRLAILIMFGIIPLMEMPARHRRREEMIRTSKWLDALDLYDKKKGIILRHSDLAYKEKDIKEMDYWIEKLKSLEIPKR